MLAWEEGRSARISFTSHGYVRNSRLFGNESVSNKSIHKDDDDRLPQEKDISRDWRGGMATGI